jgi:hypothetical protein
MIEKLWVRSWRGVLDTTLCNKVCQWLATSRWFFPGKWQDEISKEKHYVTSVLPVTFSVCCHLCQEIEIRIHIHVRIRLRLQVNVKQGTTSRQTNDIYFYMCVHKSVNMKAKCVCYDILFLQMIEFYFHRLGYWGFIFRLILLRFSFVFFINLPIHKSYMMVLSFRFWTLFDYWIFPTCHV